MLRRSPGFAAVIILTLALGIGMNTAVFSVVNAALLHPAGYPDAGRLVWLADFDFKYEQHDNYVSRPAYLAWRDQARSFESMAAYGNQDLALVAAGEASQERIASVAGDFWSITDARPALGRLFRSGEAHAMVLSYGLFQRRFGSDPQSIGKTLTVNGYPFTITGVLPKGYRFLFPQQWIPGEERREIDAYMPIPDALLRLGEISYKQEQAAIEAVGPAPHGVCVVAKRKANVSFDSAHEEMEAIWTRVARETYPDWKREFVRLHVTPLTEKLAGNTRRPLMVLLVAVAFVLLIAAANVANLLLARASTRQKEMAIRAAVGAARIRIFRQLLVESVVMAVLGGLAGLVLARWGLAVLIHLGSDAIPRFAEATVDAPVLFFTLSVSILTGILFGFGPAASSWKGSLHDVLKDDARASTAGAGRVRLRGLLVTAELALAIVLLTGAGLMLKSFWRMNASPPGFAPERILVMRISLSGPRYSTWPPKQTYIHELLRRVGATPGVQGVGVDCGTLNTFVGFEGAPHVTSPSGEGPFAAVRFVSPGYLRAVGVPLLEGHWPSDQDLFSIVVNESFARQLPGGPLGKRIAGSFLSGTIVGVVADFKHWRLDAETSPEVYYPYQRSPVFPSLRVVVRTSGNATWAAPTVRKLIAQIDRTQPVYELQTLEQALADSIAPRRFNLYLLGTFAITALGLALIGIYGVIAYSVARRTHEIGVRMALGAQRGEIVWMVVRQGMGFALAGIALGLVAALGLTRLAASLIYGVEPNDPVTFAAVGLALSATALAACSVPALKAARVDPIDALRYE